MGSRFSRLHSFKSFSSSRFNVDLVGSKQAAPLEAPAGFKQAALLEPPAVKSQLTVPVELEVGLVLLLFGNEAELVAGPRLNPAALR